MFRSIVLVIGLIAVRLLMPEVFKVFEHTSVALIDQISTIFVYTPDITTGSQTGSVGYIVDMLDGMSLTPSLSPLPPYLTK